MGEFGTGSSPQTGNISDRALGRTLNLPIQTMSDWKKREPDNWRYLIYRLIKTMTSREINKRLRHDKVRESC